MICLQRVTKVYRLEEVQVHALRDLDLTIRKGEFASIIGASGSGKSTLLNIIGCLDLPTAGEYFLNGQEVGRLSDNRLAEIRNREIGFIFQSYNLLPRLSALDNVAWPLIYRGVGARERRRRAMEALERVGLADRLQHRPNQLSGGQQQRVAVARALVGEPGLILADEPTGNLDSVTGRELIDLLKSLHAQGKTLLVITHDFEIARQAQRYITLRDGVIVAEERSDRL